VNDPRERHFRMALEHLAEGLTYEQLGANYGLSPQRIGQIIISVYARLGITWNPTAADVGLAIHRRVANNTRDREIVDTPEWFHCVLNMERQEDWRAQHYRNLD
jgi:hypothetical protein